MPIVSFAAALLAAAQPAQEPEGDPVPLNRQEWVFADDYPIEAIRARAEGRVRFSIEVDAEGNPLSCEIVESSGHALLDRTTCELMLTRARFAPARDSAGRAVAGRYSTLFTWRLQPESQGLPFVPLELVTVLAAGPDGSLTCSVGADGRRSATAERECAFFVGSGAAELLRSSGGEAQMTLVLQVMPEGASPPPRADGAWGEPIADVVAEVVLRPDGHFEDCRMTIHRMQLPQGGSFSPCPRGAGQGRPLFEASSEADRRGRIRASLYLRRGVAL